MKRKIKDYSIQFIKEIIPVIAGILIALFIDNWNSERKDKAYINQIFSTIQSELVESKEDIKAIIPKQRSLIDSLDFYANNKDVAVLDIVMRSKGIYIPKVKINAWKSVSNTKIDLIDYKKIATLSNIEELKQTLNDKSDFLMGFLYSNINQTDKNTKQTFKMIIMDIIQTEKTIQDHIEVFEKE
ncbi:hypothetical protein [Sphingobacterium spiritivorum]|uniref:hypothetical protein n=1 Tax=Sphingobacterium spiritivorum TaxID=258 RepID=UPI003DA6B0DA